MRIFSKLINLKAAFIAGGLVVPLASISTYPTKRLGLTSGNSKAMLLGSTANPAVRAIVASSCQNCHSNKTKWPWYSYIAPVSWIIANDVSEARSHMNLTNWQRYTPDEKRRLLSEIAPMVRNRVMPPQRYLALHPEAKLSASDIDELVKWTSDERRNLRGSREK